jgi:hypothetical protein
MKNNSNPLNTVILVILALIVADIFLNDGRVLASIAANAEDTTAVIDTAVYTSAPATVTYREPERATLSAPTAVPQPTYTPLPTYTPYPSASAASPVSAASPTAVPLVPDYNLPPMGPYSLQEIDLCEAIILAGNLDTLPLPQRGLCEQYVAMRNK